MINLLEYILVNIIKMSVCHMRIFQFIFFPFESLKKTFCLINTSTLCKYSFSLNDQVTKFTKSFTCLGIQGALHRKLERGKRWYRAQNQLAKWIKCTDLPWAYLFQLSENRQTLRPKGTIGNQNYRFLDLQNPFRIDGGRWDMGRAGRREECRGRGQL